MLHLHRDDVPQYLRNGDFYSALAPDDDSTFSVPVKFCTPLQTELQSSNEAEKLLETLSFWLSNELPSILIDYAVEKDPEEFDEMFRRFERTIPELHILRMVANNNFSNRYNIIAKLGSVTLMKHFKEKGEFGFWDEGVCKEAIIHGNLDCLQYAHKHGCSLPENACWLAGKHGHLSCLQYVHEQGAVLQTILCDTIASTGRLDCLKYAHQHGCVLSPSVMSTVTRLHFWDCMKYVYENGESLADSTCVEATRDNRLDILIYAHKRGCELRGTAYIALSLGRLDCFKYAYAQDPKLREVFAEVAAGGGHVECLKHVLYLHSVLSVPLSNDVCTNAARSGSTECLQLAYNAGCSWDARTCEAAASNGNLDCLMFAHKNNCPLSARAAHLAVLYEHWDCWWYLYWNNCPGALRAYWKPVMCGE